MMGILVSDDSGVIEKHVYAGDTSNISDIASTMQKANPSITCTVVDGIDPDAWKKNFESVLVVLKPTQEQVDWETAKKLGSDAAMEFLANKLGLE
jgi:hypothetical protein